MGAAASVLKYPTGHRAQAPTKRAIMTTTLANDFLIDAEIPPTALLF